jgi:SAM-dependent methyltransferase
MLNLGCGTSYHPDWVNLDIVPQSRGVIACDFRRGLPFPEGSFDVVYHSHVLEHFTRDEGKAFMEEVSRVVRPGGVVRVVVPDLEDIARLYLEKLAAAMSGDEEARADYEWMIIELLDQMVRERPGGDMRGYFLRRQLRNAGFVRSRAGSEFDITVGNAAPKAPLLKRFRLKGMRRLLEIGRDRASGLAAQAAGGRRARERYAIGTFRDSGEIHKWMYDRYSLARLLDQVGLISITQCDAMTSRILDFTSYHLDVRDNVPRKPGSLYMEGIKSVGSAFPASR